MLRKLLISVVLLLVLSLCTVMWLFHSQSGLNASLSLAKKFVPSLTIDSANGTLADKVTIENLHYLDKTGTGAAIEQLIFQWQPAALLKGIFHINLVSLTGVDVLSSAKTQETEDKTPFSLPEIYLPIDIQVDELSINNVSLIEKEQTTSLLTTAELSFATTENVLEINRFNLSRDDASVTLNGRLDLTGQHQTEITYQAQSETLLPQAVGLEGQISGNIDQLILQQTISSPLASEQRVVISNLLSELNWSLVSSAKRIQLSDVLPEQRVLIEQISINAQGDKHSATALLNADVTPDNLPTIAINAQAESTDLALWKVNIHNSLNAAASLIIDGQINTEPQQTAFDLLATWQQLSWPLTSKETIINSPNGQLKMNGSVDAYTASLTSELLYQQQPISVSAALTGNQHSMSVKQLNISGFDGNIAANAHVGWNDLPVVYELSAEWQDITLPKSVSELAIAIDKGQLELKGDQQTLTLRSESNLTINQLPMSVKLKGQGKTDVGFDETNIAIELAEGSIDYQGRLAWAGESLVDGLITLDKFNPGIIASNWPGKLMGTVPVKVKNQADTLAVSLPDLSVDGTLRDRAINLKGDINTVGKMVVIKDLRLSSANSSLNVDGKVDSSNSHLVWQLSSPDLQDFYPALKGQLNATGEITGELNQPEMNANISGKSLVYENIALANIDADIETSLLRDGKTNSSVKLAGLNLPELTIDSVKLDISGTQQAHQINLNVISPAIQLEAMANGGLEQQQWQGIFSQFNFGNDKAGKWQLGEHSLITLSADKQAFPQHCWSSEKGQLCLQANNDGMKWQTAGNFKAVPVSLFDQFLVELEQLTGSLRGKFSLASDESKAITGNGEVYLDEASVQLNQTALNQKEPLRLNNTFLKYQLDTNQTSMQLNIEPELAGVSAIKADIKTVSIVDISDHPEQAELNGELKTSIADLTALQLSHPAFDGVKGRFDMNLSIAGTVSQPEIIGKATLAHGQVKLVDAGIILKNINADIQGDIDKVDIKLKADSGEGNVAINGRYALLDKGWELSADVTGKNFEVMNTTEALVIAEPDISVLVTPKLTKVTGKVLIPRASIEPTQFNSSVSPSSDVVVINNQTTEDASLHKTDINLTISLGDKVNIKALGFQGRLTGDLTVSGDPQDILIGNGLITIKDGSYLAYGQLLKVDDGKIRFAGPIDNPELDIKAVREGKTVTAGLRIEGNVSSPQATLFSSPDMSQDNILSYILLGKPIDQASATDAALLASAASGMGLQNGAMIGDQIANTFGLDEFAITGDSKENAALTIGKALSPKLYLSYGIGVFDSISTVELRYELTKIWSIKAESGSQSGVDLMYTYEPKSDK